MASRMQEPPFSGMMSLQGQAALFIRTPLGNSLPALQSQPADSSTQFFPEFTIQTPFTLMYMSRINGSYLVQELPLPEENIHSLGTISRQLLVAWAFDIIHELQSLLLNGIHFSQTIWDQLFRIIRNHDMYRNWILSRPRNGLIQGSLVTLQNSVTSTQLSLNTTNALIILRNIWEQIEIDVKDAFGNTFMGEIYLIVVEVWTFKYYINNLVRSSKGLPQTTFSDAITEISRYTISQPFQPINPHPQPNSVATNNGITHRPSLLSIALGNTHKVADAQIQSRSSISSNPNHLAENQSQHKNSNTMVPNIKLEVNNEQKQGLPRIAARTHSAPAPSNQRHSDARTLRISAAATQSHFGAPNNPATYVGDTQLKRSATVSRDNGTITNYPSQNIKVESDTTLADTFSSPRRHGRALTNPEVAGFDTPASTHIKKERS